MTGPHLGILGGMGPLAALEFADSLVQRSIDAGLPAEAAPEVTLRNASMPPRVGLDQEEPRAVLGKAIDDGLRRLALAGATDLVICCFTAHAVVSYDDSDGPHLDNLVGRATEDMSRRGARTLVMCSRESRRLRIFGEAGHDVVYLNDADETRLMDAILALKSGREVGLASATMSQIADHYDTEAVLLGCSELHRPGADLYAAGRDIIDPLGALADELVTRSGHAA